ncbi:hypothetical protein ACQ4WX_27565 [Streptomyces lasalocidi]
MTSGGNGTRLLPWTGLGGKPCYLVTDGSGQMSRIADTVERVQLGMAHDLLGHASDLLADDGPTRPPTPVPAGPDERGSDRRTPDRTEPWRPPSRAGPRRPC